MANLEKLLGYLSGSVAVATLPTPAIAQTLEIAPITVDMPVGRMTSTIRITNRSNQSTTVQVRPFAWSQPKGEDRLEPTPDVLLSPPFSTLAPGDTQTVRIVLRGAATQHERAYRLLVDQLPSAADPGSIRVALRISLPVFVAPVGASRSVLTWRLVGSDAHKRMLIVRNEGGRRAKIFDLKIDQAVTAPNFTFRYILAGSETAIPVEAKSFGWASPGGNVHISAGSDQGKVESDAPIMPAA